MSALLDLRAVLPAILIVCCLAETWKGTFTPVLKYHNMKMCGGVEVNINILVISAICGGEWSASRPGRFIPGKELGETIRQQAEGVSEPVWMRWRRE
jgi:hypothetical protein